MAAKLPKIQPASVPFVLEIFLLAAASSRPPLLKVPDKKFRHMAWVPLLVKSVIMDQ